MSGTWKLHRTPYIDDTYQSKANSSMHHYECIALYKDINLQRGRFWASSLASCILASSRPMEERSPWMVFIQVVRGHPGGTYTNINSTHICSQNVFRFLLIQTQDKECKINQDSFFLWRSLFLAVMLIIFQNQFIFWTFSGPVGLIPLLQSAIVLQLFPYIFETYEEYRLT